MRNGILTGLLALIATRASAQTLALAQGENDALSSVFLSDNRVAMTSRAYPWSAIGQIRATGLDLAKGMNVCTGTLIARNLVLTAAHCTVDEEGKPFAQLKFFPNYRLGQDMQGTLVTGIWRGTSDRKREPQKDWAILKLAAPLGDQYGALTVRPLDWSNPNEVTKLRGAVTLAGYSTDFGHGMTAGLHAGCSVRETFGELLFHDCDSEEGSSGGALIVRYGSRYEIIGVHVAERVDAELHGFPKGIEYSTLTANVAVEANQFYNTYLELTRGAAPIAAPAPVPLAR